MPKLPIITHIFNTILDALFPRSAAELESLSYSPETTWEKLPRAPEPPLADAFSIFAYKDERVSKLVWNIKYKKSERAVAIGGYALYRRFVEFSEKRAQGILSFSANPNDACRQPSSSNIRFAENDNMPCALFSENSTLYSYVVIPIPITQKRRNERGYNQCELLADEMKRLDINNRFIVCKDLLERVQHLSRQTLKNREDRLESAKGIFAVNEEVAGRIKNYELVIRDDNTATGGITIIVIDDVITTGSTMKSAMETLKNAGFDNVFGLSLAH